MPRWYVGFDNERVGTFDSEEEALHFASVDSQLEVVAAVVMRHDTDGTRTIVGEFVPTVPR